MSFFSGTDIRKALNVAEVTLVIENEAGNLAFDRPELSIKRRIFRDSESEYYLNGTPVRLKDIRELFLDTGVGKSAYSIMEQGKIDQILSNKPEDRRHLFEEAAGIAKYRMRGQEAESKLANTEDNMKQVQRILQEVDKQYENLKTQMQNTLKYREFKEKIFEIERNLKLIRWKEIEKNRSQRSLKMDVRNKKRVGIAEKLSTIKSAMSETLDSINNMNQTLLDNQKKLYGIGLEKENIENQSRSIRERRTQMDESLKSYSKKELNIQQIITEIEERRNFQNTELEGFQQRMKEIEAGIKLCGDTLSAAKKHLIHVDDEIDKTSKALQEEEKHRDRLQEELHSLTDNIVQELDRRLSDWGRNQQDRRGLEERISIILNELKIRLEGRSTHLADMVSMAESSNIIGQLEASSADLKALTTLVAELGSLFDESKALSGGFLEEFLAPGGIITKKRSSDEQMHVSRGKIQGYREQIAVAETEKSVLTEKIQETGKRLEEFRDTHARAAAQTAAAKERLISFMRESAAEEKRLGDIRGQMESEKKRIAALDKESEDLKHKNKNLDSRQKQIMEETASLESNISTENKQMAEWEKKIKTLSEQLAAMDIDKERISIQVENLLREEKQLLEDFRDSHSRELSDFAELKETIRTRPETLKKEQTDIKDKLKNLGRVNLMAPEEFAEVSERRDFLTAQLNDLGTARDDLTRIMEEILKETSGRFLKTFTQIHNNFHEMFRQLFGGGKAKIHLINPEEPLNTGLEIYVQPPGKKLENISLLSGGEKALCSIALLFATFMVKPSPFCILDEIDAALDEANVHRFVNVLSDFGQKSQFIIITHNKKTVTGAHSLLGVTMQESGVSQLVSLKLDTGLKETGLKEIN